MFEGLTGLGSIAFKDEGALRPEESKGLHVRLELRVGKHISRQ
jgi:hypothetical protein